MSTQDLADSLGETIDRLMSIEMRSSGFMTGVVPALYAAVRAQSGGPLAWNAASRLLESLEGADTAVIITGHVHPVVMPMGETDGPLGAAVLARTLNLTCDVQVVVLCDEQVIEVMHALLQRAGVLVTRGLPASDAPLVKARVHLAAIPTELPAAQQLAQELVTSRRVGAAISVEKISPNDRGVLHSALGNDLNGILGRGDAVIDAVRETGALTIGIGDLGNEIGFGSLQAVVRQIVPFGDRCACPCGGGTAAATATDVVLPAGTSNWGAYALVAALCAMTGRYELLHDSATEMGMLEVASAAGAVDGLSTGPTLDVDGIPGTAHGWWADLLGCAVRIATSTRRSERVKYEAAAGIPSA